MKKLFLLGVIAALITQPLHAITLRERVVDQRYLDITNLDDLNAIKNPESVWAITFSGNQIEHIKSDTFKKFKNLLWLDLSNNNLKTIDPNAFKGLDYLQVLLLHTNQLNSFPKGSLYGLKRLKYLTVSSNPGKLLKKQAVRQLPRTTVVYTGAVSTKIIASFIGALAIIGLSIVLYNAYKVPKEEQTPATPQPLPTARPALTHEEQQLFVAADEGILATVQHLIGKDPAIIDSRNQRKETPLIVAVRKGHTKVVNYLLQQGANYTLVDQLGRAAIHHAFFVEKGTPEQARLSSEELVKLLVEKGKDNVGLPDHDGYTPLHFAVLNQQPESIEFLIGNGADINATNKLGETPLFSIIGKRGTAILEKLLSYPACNPNAQNTTGDTVLHTLAADRDTDSRNLGILDLLWSDKRIDVNIQNKDGDTALHKAAANETESSQVADRIFYHTRIDQTIRNNKGQTAFDIACANKGTHARKLQKVFETYAGQTCQKAEPEIESPQSAEPTEQEFLEELKKRQKEIEQRIFELRVGTIEIRGDGGKKEDAIRREQNALNKINAQIAAILDNQLTQLKLIQNHQQKPPEIWPAALEGRRFDTAQQYSAYLEENHPNIDQEIADKKAEIESLKATAPQ